MPRPWSDVDALTDAWNSAVGDVVPPLGSHLRHAFPYRWVRFHTLPGGERIAATGAQQQEVLARYHTVLEALGQPDVVTTCGWQHDGGQRPAGLVELMPAARWLRTADGTTVYATALAPGDDLDELLLRWVAADRTAEVILAPRGLEWLVHPYDGGIDVIALDMRQRDELRSRFGQWSSPRADGL